MTVAMGPPPPRNVTSSSEMDSESENINYASTSASASGSSSTDTSLPMRPPPPKKPSLSNPDQPVTEVSAHEDEPRSSSSDFGGVEPAENASDDSSLSERGVKSTSHKSQSQSPAVPYTIPPWSEAPDQHFFLEVLKDGSIIDHFDVNEKGAYMFGRVDLCDFILEHPTISRFHAVLQFRSNGGAYLYDLGSTHGTFINKREVKKKVYVDLCVGDVIRFGQSSRLYLFQGPPDLMPPEVDLKMIRDAKSQEERFDREASLHRARQQASLADGISWGMGEDAIEEAEEDVDEVTWQTYKGQLTEKQEKTREKVLKRTGKIAHMKKEIDAIRAKDIAQGGLTQGQQTQIARNEQRISQILEELENLEETLNESIRESLGARTGKMFRGKRHGATEDDEELLSDDDEFYDRTKKKQSNEVGCENQSVETADTLLDKRDAIMKEMEDKREMIVTEKKKLDAVESDAGDALDAYMSGLSSQLVVDKATQLQNELSSLQSELDRILYLLKIADPTGEAEKKRTSSELQEPKPVRSKTPTTPVSKKQPVQKTKLSNQHKQVNGVTQKEEEPKTVMSESIEKPNASKTEDDNVKDGKATAYTAVKPQWLGAVEGIEMEETQKPAAPLNMHEPDNFVDYKDRQRILDSVDDIENASGLILRKRKKLEKSEGSSHENSSQRPGSSSAGAEFIAEDAVALLLKHKKGLYPADEEERPELKKSEKKLKRVIGPAKPAFLDTEVDYEAWVPPEGQSGDGKTSLNERYGY